MAFFCSFEFIWYAFLYNVDMALSTLTLFLGSPKLHSINKNIAHFQEDVSYLF